MARNECVFNNRIPKSVEVAAKAKALLLEIIDKSTFAFILSAEVSAWLGPCVPGERKDSINKSMKDPTWRLRLTAGDFLKWWQGTPKATIFFNGASKGNPGTAGAGGLILSLDRLKKTIFSWGLGISSNNQVESYSLLKAFQIAKELDYKSIQIFGDSELLIKLLNFEDYFSNLALNKTLQRIRNTLKDFDTVDSYHILWDLNKQVDSLANKACLLP